MPFLAERTIHVPEVDLISWYFDNPPYDLDTKIYIDASKPSRYYTGAQSKKLIMQLAAGFKAHSLKEGDTVALHSFSDIDYPIVANGTVAFGGIFAGTNPSYTLHELVHHMHICKTKMMLVERDLLKTALHAADKARIPRDRVLVFDHDQPADAPRDIDGLKSWRTLLDHGQSDWLRFRGDKAKTAIAAFLSTSGTTGMPKAGIITHHNFIAQAMAVYEGAKRKWEIKRLMATPMFHAATVPSAHFTPLHIGCQLYVLRRFTVDEFLQGVQDHKITECPIVPPMCNAIINHPNRTKYNLSSLRYATSGAAPLGKDQQRRFKELMRPDATFTQVWGMTECTCIASMLEPGEHDDTGSVGRAVHNVDVKLVDDDNRDVTDFDTRGEICVRGPSIIQGYYENPEANKDWDSEGYFHTGDIAVRTKDGLYYLVDRKKELIKVRGFQVAPPELEAVLHQHPAVADAAVIGVQMGKGDDLVEMPRAYVTKNDGQQATEQQIYDFVAERVAKYKRLDGGVVFMQDIPKNPSGKILKRKLREKAKREMGSRL